MPITRYREREEWRVSMERNGRWSLARRRLIQRLGGSNRRLLFGHDHPVTVDLRSVSVLTFIVPQTVAYALS